MKGLQTYIKRNEWFTDMKKMEEEEEKYRYREGKIRTYGAAIQREGGKAAKSKVEKGGINRENKKEGGESTIYKGGEIVRTGVEEIGAMEGIQRKKGNKLRR